MGSATQFVPCPRAEAPTDQVRTKAGVETRSRPAASRPELPRTKPSPRAAKAKANAASKSTKKKTQPASRRPVPAASARGKVTPPKARAKPRAAKAAEAQELDVATSPDQPCHVQLRSAGVSFVKVSAQRAPEVHLPIRLTGSVAGVEIRGTGKNQATHYLDCHLALALVRWAAPLKAVGVVRIDHYSIYRPDAEVAGTRKPSGHALALAIDAGRFHLSDGRVLTVLDTWADKTKGADPCTARAQESADEHLLRELVCNAARSSIFQTIVTPHHNPEHDNHVHLEVSRAFAPTWIH